MQKKTLQHPDAYNSFCQLNYINNNNHDDDDYSKQQNFCSVLSIVVTHFLFQLYLNNLSVQLLSHGIEMKSHLGFYGLSCIKQSLCHYQHIAKSFDYFTNFYITVCKCHVCFKMAGHCFQCSLDHFSSHIVLNNKGNLKSHLHACMSKNQQVFNYVVGNCLRLLTFNVYFPMTWQTRVVTE